ncbi:MAG: hypothetical protein ACLFRE_00090 [Desulfovermiculus sp.]
MYQSTDQTRLRTAHSSYQHCQCCGRVLEKSRLRYCSRQCKDNFTLKLGWFNNLLRVVETRYATFSFTEAHLVLNILPRHSHVVYTYMFTRMPGHKPAQDMDPMIFSLGKIWWGHRDKTKSEKRASRHVLSKGSTCLVGQQSVEPVSRETAPTVGKQLRQLKMQRTDLLHPIEAEERLKRAFRQAALASHPDTGGDPAAFRQVYAAYQDLLSWIENPRYQRRRGVPGQWCYVAGRSAWLTPL